MPDPISKQAVWFITGCSTGFGRELATQLLAQGSRVAVTARDPDTLKEFEGKTNAQVLKLDVTDPVQVSAAVASVGASFGPIDVLVNNAGITRDRMFLKMSREDWDAVIETNLNSMFNVTKQVIEGMIEAGFGRVINISSVNGQKGQFGQHFGVGQVGCDDRHLHQRRDERTGGAGVDQVVSPGPRPF